jgi:exoribonuclease-2
MVTPEFEIAHESASNRPIVANLRHHDIEPLFNAQTLADGLSEFAFRDELRTLWHLANACEGRRGKPSSMQGNHDYNFSITGDPSDDESSRVEISERMRGSPLDKLVAELMIVANSTWGGVLAEKGIPAIYRAQGAGKVRMTTSPQAHDGLGVAQYAWSSSPLRRYVDLLNHGKVAWGDAEPNRTPFAARDFDLAYCAYAN